MVHRVIELARRPVAWGAVIISYAGIIAAVSFAAATGASNSGAVREEAIERDRGISSLVARVEHEAMTRERDLCGVVIAVHRNAKFRLRTEVQALHSQRDYVRTGEDADLRRRIRETLPLTEARVAIARNNVNATRPPATCDPYREQKR